jgi:hypothetical protein
LRTDCALGVKLSRLWITVRLEQAIHPTWQLLAKCRRPSVDGANDEGVSVRQQHR